MFLKRFLACLVILAVAAGCTPRKDVSSMTEAELTEYARGIHDRVVTLDTHDDIPFDFATADVDPGVREGRQVTLPKMREGGLNTAFFVVFVGQADRTPEGYEKAYRDAVMKFDAIHRMAEEMYPDQIEIAYTPDDVVRIHNEGKLVAVISMENGYPIGKDLSKLEEFYERGARYITLSHNGHNDICDSANPAEGEPEAEHNGVSEFGKEVIAEMNRLGIMVDIAHVSKKSALDAMALSKAPVIDSHAASRALCDVSRNLDDETLLALKKNGGVIQTVALRDFVKKVPVPPERQEALAALMKEFNLPGPRGEAYRKALRALTDERRAEFDQKMAELDERYPVEKVTVQDYVDHIDYIVNLIGIDHVGISSDFDGGGGVDGWDDASETFNVTLELVKRGYTEQEIAKLWSGNTLRVWRDVERVAQELQKKADD